MMENHDVSERPLGERKDSHEFGTKPRFSIEWSSSNYMLDWKDDGWTPGQRAIGQWLMTQTFDSIMGVLIVFNAVLVVIETDLRAEESEIPIWLQIPLYALQLAYIIEICLRFYVLRLKEFFRSAWNLVDFVVVSVDLLGEILNQFLAEYNVISFSVLRTVRLVRLLKALRFLTDYRELYMMMHGMGSAMKAIFWATVLIGSTLLLWSIIATEVLNPLNRRISRETNIYENCDRCERAFASVFSSLLTFTQQIIAGDSWGEVTIPIMEYAPWTVFIFIAVIITVHLGLLNLVLAVIVDRAQECRQEDMKRRLRDRNEEYGLAKNRLATFFNMMDEDGNGTLSLPEIMEGFDLQPDFADALKLMDVSKDDLGMVFRMLDEDGSGEVDFSEFVEGLHKMKTQNSHTLLMFIKFYVQEVRKSVATQIRTFQDPLMHRVNNLEEGVVQVSQLLLGPANAISKSSPRSPLSPSSMAKARSQGNGESDAMLSGKFVPMAPMPTPKMPDWKADHDGGSVPLTTSMSKIVEELHELRLQVDQDVASALKSVVKTIHEQLAELKESVAGKLPPLSTAEYVLSETRHRVRSADGTGEGENTFKKPMCCAPEKAIKPDRLQPAVREAVKGRSE